MTSLNFVFDTFKSSSNIFRIQKELAEITLDPPPNCRLVTTPSYE